MTRCVILSDAYPSFAQPPTIEKLFLMTAEKADAVLFRLEKNSRHV